MGHLVEGYRVSVRRACQVMKQARSYWYYRPKENGKNILLLKRIEEIATTRVRYGLWRIYVLLRREGWQVNHKRVHRLYKQAGLNLRNKRPKRRKSFVHRLKRPQFTAPNQSWSMDFVSDALFDGRKLRILTIVDNFTKESLAIYVNSSITSEKVVQIIERLRNERGAPMRIQTDNGSEFSGLQMDRWAYENDVLIDFSRPAKPTDNPFIESFNGKFRDECLNIHWFLSVEDAREKIENWRQDYNNFRPHSALKELTPAQFASQYTINKAPIFLF